MPSYKTVKPAERAFRENAGVAVAALAEGLLKPLPGLQIERGTTPTDDELEVTLSG